MAGAFPPPAFKEDFFERVISVQWLGGLAVEISEGSTLTTLPATFFPALNLSKATISLWFRVPAEAGSAIKGAKQEVWWDFEVLNGVLPLLVLGKSATGPVSDWHGVDLGLMTSTPGQHVFVSQYDRTRQVPMSPTTIGFYITENGTAELFVHLQTEDRSIASATSIQAVSYTDSPGHGNPFTFEDVSQQADVVKEYFEPNVFGGGVSGGEPPRCGGGGVEVSYDTWHHLLISWDITGTNSSHGQAELSDDEDVSRFIDSTSKMYVALDDKNITKDELPVQFAGKGPNSIICAGAWSWAGSVNHSDEFGISHYSVSFSEGIKADTIIIPCEASYARSPGPPDAGAVRVGATTPAKPQKTLEFAELQIFSETMLDTSKTQNRRAFISKEEAEDEHGNSESVLQPVDPEKAEKLIGRKPDILLHGSSNWIKGINTGSKEGDFEPRGDIKKYTPDPSINQPNSDQPDQPNSDQPDQPDSDQPA